MPTSSVQVDQGDVATVEALEAKTLEFVRELQAAYPALTRLKAAGYAGAEAIDDEIGSGSTDDAGGDVIILGQLIEQFRTSKGDRAAWDYQELCVRRGMSVHEAIEDILQALSGADEVLDRVAALREYAAKRAPIRP